MSSKRAVFNLIERDGLLIYY